MKRTPLVLAVWLGIVTGLLAWDTRPTPVLPDGTPIQLALPQTQHMSNTGGSDGAGLCVYTSVTLAAKWQNLTDMYSFRKFAEGRPGGSWPEKLDADIKTYAQRYNVSVPAYVQHTGGDDAFLDLCIATRRMPGITYAGKDDFYDSTILHMVDLAHLDAKSGAIQDNNRAGRWTSDTRQKILNRWKGLDDNGKDLLVPMRQGLRTVWVPAGGGWAFVWLGAPPPPRPPTAGNDAIPDADANRFVGHWERTVLADETVAWAYWTNGELVGVFSDGKWYRGTVDAEERDGAIVSVFTLGDRFDAPAGLSPPEAEPTDDWNKGVETWKFDRKHRYWINGVEVSRAKAYAAVSDVGDGLIDDSGKYHLSIVGADKKAISAFFAPSGPLADYARRLHIQVYTKDAWPTEYLSATVTLQEPAKMSGKIVGVGSDPTEAGIRKVLSSVFDTPPPVKPDPVKPAPTPTPAPEPKPVEPLPKTPNWLYALLAALAALFVRKQVR